MSNYEVWNVQYVQISILNIKLCKWWMDILFWFCFHMAADYFKLKTDYHYYFTDDDKKSSSKYKIIYFKFLI